MGPQRKTKAEKIYEVLHATMKALECQQSGTSLQHRMGRVLVMGLVALLKRLAAKAGLQQPYNDQIMTPHQLYEWAQSSIHNLNFDSVTQNQYKEEDGLLSC
jgi:hypothetical protein